jgi:integrase
LEGFAVSARIPSYRLHKPTGQAVVTLNGRDYYLGGHNTAASRDEYNRLVAEWLAGGRQLGASDRGAGPGADITVAELILAYVRFADGYYVKDGRPTKEAKNVRFALKPLRQLYGHTPAAKFGPLGLKAVRQAMIEADICRLEVNRRTGRIVRAFKWAVENELIPPAIHQGLKAVSWLRRGRSEARESEPVKPVPEPSVDAIRPHVARQVWAMVELQRVTGMRPGEVTIMRGADIDRGGSVWTYTPRTHKTEHHGKERVIYLGPRAQAVLRPWLRADHREYLFQPREAMAERWAEQRRQRRTPVQPSQASRKRSRPAKQAGESYTVDSYRRAITAGCGKANVDPWHPHQLRHNAATWLRREFGLDAARDPRSLQPRRNGSLCRGRPRKGGCGYGEGRVIRLHSCSQRPRCVVI